MQNERLLNIPSAKASSHASSKVEFADKKGFFMLVFWFALTPLSKLLEYIGAPRVAVYGLFLVALFFYIIDRLYVFSRKTDGYLDLVVFYAILTPAILYGLITYRSFFSNESALYVILIIFYPAYFMIRSCDFETIKNAIRVSSYITLLFYYPQIWITSLGIQYMEYSYWIEFSLCAITYFAIKERKPIDIALSAYGLITLLVFGCRGALVGTFLFLVYLYLKDGITAKKIIAIVLIALLGVALYANIELIYSYLSSSGIQSRTLRLIITESFADANGRDGIYAICQGIIEQMGFPGGPLSSRALLAGYPYPHSLFYELLIDFGPYLGFALFLGIILSGIYLLVFVKDEDVNLLAGLFFIVGVATLMMSSSLYHQFYIPAVIALLFGYKADLRSRFGANDVSL